MRGVDEAPGAVVPMSRKDRDRWLREAVRRNLPPMRESAMFLALFTENYEKDATAVLQFGLAVLLDKPIYLVMPRGTHLPENLRRIAKGIGEYDSIEDCGAVTKRLLEAAGEIPPP